MTRTRPAPAQAAPAALPLRANERVPGWDGTPLAVDVHLPPHGRWPVPTVVTRTAYGRSSHLAEGTGWRERGFAYVVQDVRGRYDSDGTWHPYRNERGDGAALADWITEQPWSDGRLIGYGGSYAGHTAWALAAERPDAVRAVVSMGPSMALSRTKFERSGILRLAEHAAWWLERADARTSRDGLTAQVFRDHPGLLDHLPVLDLADRLGARLPGWAQVVTDGPDHRAEGPDTDELTRLPAAALHIGGWYDLLVDEVLEHFAHAGSALTPRPSRALVIGPWGHDLAYAPGTRVGDREHGPRSRVDLGSLQVDWLRRVLTGEERAGSTAHVFTVGENRWWTRTSWPPPTTRTVWHARPDGTLDPRPPTSGGEAHFRYDPADPHPSRPPAVDRAPLAARRDAVRFTSAPLTAPLTVDGRPAVLLDAVSSAPATDWIVRWIEITAEGRRLELAHGSLDTARVPATGTEPPYPIGLGPVSVTVPVGSRLQLEVTSSDFPRLARSTGTGGDRYRSTVCAVADQTVRVRPVDGTRLILPRTAPEETAS